MPSLNGFPGETFGRGRDDRPNLTNIGRARLSGVSNYPGISQGNGGHWSIQPSTYSFALMRRYRFNQYDRVNMNRPSNMDIPESTDSSRPSSHFTWAKRTDTMACLGAPNAGSWGPGQVIEALLMARARPLRYGVLVFTELSAVSLIDCAEPLRTHNMGNCSKETSTPPPPLAHISAEVSRRPILDFCVGPHVGGIWNGRFQAPRIIRHFGISFTRAPNFGSRIPHMRPNSARRRISGVAPLGPPRIFSEISQMGPKWRLNSPGRRTALKLKEGGSYNYPVYSGISTWATNYGRPSSAVF